MRPGSIAELQNLVPNYPQLRLRGGGSKSALAPSAGEQGVIEMDGLAGILEYQPQEFTFTALAGTPLRLIENKLAENGQYLPFDPPLVGSGATLGGTIASGLSGAGRYRYGGLRDFLLGVTFVDAQGRLVRGGGKVVKNAAGFDLPKLMVGSLGQYGALVEVCFKVFPRTASYATLRTEYATLAEALESLVRLSLTPLEIYALELLPESGSYNLLARLGGAEDTLVERLDRLREMLGHGQALDGSDEHNLWQAESEFSWVPAGYMLVKVPITPRQVPALDALLNQQLALRHYSVGANLAWIAWPGALAELDQALTRLELSGLVILGETDAPRLGVRTDKNLERRVKQALDPQNRWGEV
jgi:glycolate oxidase FAD binding subunit